MKENETKKAWDEVGERFSEVGRRIGEHYRKMGAEAEAAAEEQGRALNDAVKKAVDELDHALTAVGDSLRDQQTKDSLKQAARSFGDALSATFSNLSEEIRKRVGPKDTDPKDTGPAG
jgi:DNA-binding ferritin-like protein